MRTIDLKGVPLYYISLDDALDRQQNFLSWAAELGFQSPTRVSAIRSENYFLGLAEAHYNAISLGMQSGMPFIVFEDDATPNYENEDYLIRIPHDADAVYLGASPYAFDNENPTQAKYGAEFVEVADKDLFRVKNATTLHAVLYMTKEYSEASLKENMTTFTDYFRAGDLAIAENVLPNYNVYFTKPLFYQNDTNKPYVTKITREINANDFLVSEGQHVK